MRVKPRISRRADGRWTVRRPLVGFRPTPDETGHDSWTDAVRSMTDVADLWVQGGQYERDRQDTDQIAAVPKWTPLSY